MKIDMAAHSVAIAENILAKEDISFDIIKPLIKETVEKCFSEKPVNAQTGPALRNDLNVLRMHKELLSDSPLIKKIYSFVSESIFNFSRQVD